MGCDIHFFVERYATEPDNSNGPKDISAYRQERIDSIVENSAINPRWISADNWEFVDYGNDESYWRCQEIYDSRNYWLFYFLGTYRFI